MRKIIFTIIFPLLAATAFAQQMTANKPLKELSVDHMMPAHLTAGTNVPDDKAIGGFAASGNAPKKLDASDVFLANAIMLVADTNTETVFYPDYKGIRLLLINTTEKEEWFSAQDSRMNIIQEALDTDGAWKAIETFPTSWCGNSYHRVRLGPNEYWEFPAARYYGKFKTRLRFRLDERSPIYSNEFEGSINRGQFIKPKRPGNSLFE